MNLKQLEEIRKKVEEIKSLISLDSTGAIDVHETVKELEEKVLRQMRAELWSLYEQGKVRIIEEA